MKFIIPGPLKREHEELHEELRKATNEVGAVGDAAKALAKLAFIPQLLLLALG